MGIGNTAISIIGNLGFTKGPNYTELLEKKGISLALQSYVKTQGVKPEQFAQFIVWAGERDKTPELLDQFLKGQNKGQEIQAGVYRTLHLGTDGFLQDGDYSGHAVAQCEAPQFKELSGIWNPDQVAELCRYLGVTEPANCFLSLNAAQAGKVCFEANQPGRNREVLERVDGFMWSHGDCPFDWSHCDAIQDAEQEALGVKDFLQRIWEDLPGTLLTVVGFGLLGWWFKDRLPPSGRGGGGEGGGNKEGPPKGPSPEPIFIPHLLPAPKPITNPSRLLPEHSGGSSADVDTKALFETGIIVATMATAYKVYQAAAGGATIRVASGLPGMAKVAGLVMVAGLSLFGGSREAAAAELPQEPGYLLGNHPEGVKVPVIRPMSHNPFSDVLGK